MVLLSVFIANKFSCLHGKAELPAEEEDDGTDAVPCILSYVEGFVGSALLVLRARWAHLG